MTKYEQDPEHEGLYLPLPGHQHYCAPATWTQVASMNQSFSFKYKHRSGWVLVREKVTRIAGNSGWTTQEPGAKPEVLAYRNQGERIWYKGSPGHGVRIETTRRENIEEEEVVAVMLMARKA
jgi:hypothetical protein